MIGSWLLDSNSWLFPEVKRPKYTIIRFDYQQRLQLYRMTSRILHISPEADLSLPVSVTDLGDYVSIAPAFMTRCNVMSFKTMLKRKQSMGIIQEFFNGEAGMLVSRFGLSSRYSLSFDGSYTRGTATIDGHSYHIGVVDGLQFITDGIDTCRFTIVEDVEIVQNSTFTGDIASLF